MVYVTLTLFTIFFSLSAEPAFCVEQWDLLNEEWDSLGNWEVTNSPPSVSEISPSGELHQKEVSNTIVTRYQVLANGLPLQFTFETKIKIESFASGAFHRWRLYNNEHQILLELFPDRIQCYHGIDYPWYDEIAVTTETGVFYTWRFLVDSKGATVKVYRDALFLGQFIRPNAYDGHLNGRIKTGAVSYEEDHEDFFRISSGLHEPEGGSAGGKTPTPPWYRVLWERVAELLKTKVKSPLWSMVTTLKPTFEGLIALLIVGVLTYSCYKLVLHPLFFKHKRKWKVTIRER